MSGPTSFRLHMVWDNENRLVEVSNPVPAPAPTPGPTRTPSPKRAYLPMALYTRFLEQYAYDADGQRIKRANAGGTTYYYGSAFEVRVPTTGPTQVTKYYTFNGQRIAMRLPDGTLNYLHGDHLGSTVLATKSDGTVANACQPRYDAYGSERVPASCLPTDNTYTGQKRDTSWLLYYGARFYDPVIGTFIAPDTVVPQPGDPKSLNRYLYTNGNPLRYSDPSGHLAEDELQTLLGDDYDTLMNLWKQYDPYWYDMILGDELQGGGVLTASELGGLELHFEGSGKDIQAKVYGGTYSSSLANWQGKGAYQTRNPGESEAQSVQRRDEMFQRYENCGLPNAMLQPAFAYAHQYGKLTPKYLGASIIYQGLGDFPGGKGTVQNAMEKLGTPSWASWGMQTGVYIGLIWAPPPVALSVSIADMITTAGAWGEAPSQYSSGWSGGVAINSSIELLDLVGAVGQ